MRIASDPPLRNAARATRAVSSGTSGHGPGCIDMMTRFCGRERGQGKVPATADDHGRHHIRRLRHRPAGHGSVTALSNRVRARPLKIEGANQDRASERSTHGPWTYKEIAYGITSLPADLAGPRHLALYARHHWAIENREHYVHDKTFSEDLQRARTGNQPNAWAAIRNLVTGSFRRAGYANIAHARRYYGRDDQRVLGLYGYT
jgi:hypothetical protein